MGEFDGAHLRRQRVISPLARDEQFLLTIEEFNRIKREHYGSGQWTVDSGQFSELTRRREE
jgi:hypothetical protein